MKKELLILKRKKAKELFNNGWSISKIAQYLLTRKNTVSYWIKLNDKDVLIDRRGWKKGKPRKYNSFMKEEIKKIRNELEKEDSYFIGANRLCYN